MINQEKRNDIAHRRLNQFMQDGKALDYLHNIANIEINKITLENKDKNESASTCHSERTSRWTNNDVKVETSSRKNRYQRAVEREKFSRNLSKKYEDFNSISPSKSACNSNHIINDNEIFDQNISIKEMFNFRDLKNEEGMISIIKEKFNQIIRDLKDTYLSNANRFLVRENFLELKRKFTNNPKQHEQLITEFFNKNIKDINDIFYQLEECYFSTIKSPEFIEKLIGPISKFFEEKNININFENVLKEEFFNIILNDEFFKEIIEEIEKRDLIILAKIKSLIKNIKEEFLQKHSEKIFLESPLIFNCSYKSKIEIVSNSTNTNNTISYTKATTIHNKISRESKIVSPVNYTLKSIPSNNSQNENDYKNINDWVEYINSENNIKNKKNKKKNNFSKKNNKTNNKNSVSNTKSDNNLIDKSEINEIDSEIEEFKRKISNESIKANLIEKIKPRFTEKWIKLLISYLDN